MKCLTESLESLQPWQQICYGAAVVTRMYPNFELFCEVSQQQDAGTFKNILQLVWEFASGQNTSIDFLRQLDKLEQIVPNPDQFDGYGAWPALDATTALSALLSACHTFDTDEISALLTLSRSTIEHYLQAAEDNRSVGSHPLTIADNDFHNEVIHCLSKHSKTMKRKDCVISIRTWVKTLPVSNIGVSFSQ